LMIAQDTGSAIVGPARADIFWGAGDRAGQIANHVHHPGNFALLVPRELDPVTAGARIPLPAEKPSFIAQAKISTSFATSPNTCRIGPLRDPKTCTTADAGVGSRAKQMNVR
jgi:3D domain